MVISEIYAVTDSSSMTERVMESYAYDPWPSMTKVTQTNHGIWDRRRELDDVHLKLTITFTPPGLIIPRDPISGQFIPSAAFGYQIDIIEEMRKQLGFTYELMVPESGSFGTFNSTSATWNGMMGQLISKEADMSLLLQVTKERAELIDFTRPAFYTTLNLVRRRELSNVVSLASMFDRDVSIVARWPVSRSEIGKSGIFSRLLAGEKNFWPECEIWHILTTHFDHHFSGIFRI